MMCTLCYFVKKSSVSTYSVRSCFYVILSCHHSIRLFVLSSFPKFSNGRTIDGSLFERYYYLKKEEQEEEEKNCITKYFDRARRLKLREGSTSHIHSEFHSFILFDFPRHRFPHLSVGRRFCFHSRCRYIFG